MHEPMPPMSAVTFRLPPAAIEQLHAVAEIAAQSTERVLTVADVYRWALARYLVEHLPDALTQPPDQLSVGPLGVEATLDATHPTKTVCVHLSATMRDAFEQLLERQRAALAPAVARSLTVSQLYVDAVGSLLLAVGVRLRGWNC